MNIKNIFGRKHAPENAAPQQPAPSTRKEKPAKDWIETIDTSREMERVTKAVSAHWASEKRVSGSDQLIWTRIEFLPNGICIKVSTTTLNQVVTPMTALGYEFIAYGDMTFTFRAPGCKKLPTSTVEGRAA